MTRVICALAATTALAVAGCGSSSSNDSASPTPAASTPQSADTPATPATGGVAIKMANIQFSPTATTIKVGQKVTWTNDDSVDHNVTATGGEKFASDNFGKGGTYSYTATKPETIKYTCTIHPGMDGTLTVVK